MDQDEPQKPIPRTEGKQSAGHFYSTRSKVKRTSHSETDDGSSGSKSLQPPLKRQTRLDEEQADKSVEIRNNDATPDSDPIDLNTLDECTSPEIALQNDLVLETLLRFMNHSDLLRCRVVNTQWQYEATKELRRRNLCIKFSFQSKGNKVIRNIAFQEICRRLSDCRTPSLLSTYQVKTVARNDLASAGVRNIFATVGNQLTHLTLDLNYWSKKCSFKSSSLMNDLHNLLFRQTPNLKMLEIGFNFPEHWKDDLQLLALNSSDQLQRDNNEFLLLPNLKEFIVGGTPPPKLLREVINSAVNVRSLGGAWSACSTYFLGAEGGAKIHQLKRLQMAVYSQDHRNERFIEEMETFLADHKQNIKLETFGCASKFVHGNTSTALRTVSVINQILKCSAGSLQKLRIEPTKWLDDLLIIPCLPKLQEILIDCYWSSRGGFSGIGFFPRGFNMNTSLPNVSSIFLLGCTAVLFRRFVNRVAIELPEPVPSIRYIVLNDKGNKSSIVPSLPTVADFRHIFPNLVSISYVDSEKYYKI